LISPVFPRGSSGSLFCLAIIPVPPRHHVISLLHQPQTNQKMKTNSILLSIITVFTLHASTLFAGETRNENFTTAPRHHSTTEILTKSPSLQVTTAIEATFEDISETNSPVIINFTADSPVEADFNDNTDPQTIDILPLIMETPTVADFEELV